FTRCGSVTGAALAVWSSVTRFVGRKPAWATPPHPARAVRAATIWNDLSTGDVRRMFFMVAGPSRYRGTLFREASRSTAYSRPDNEKPIFPRWAASRARLRRQGGLLAPGPCERKDLSNKRCP